MRRAGLALVVGCAAAFGAAADEIRVLSTSAFAPVLQQMLPGFESRTRHKVLFDHDGVAALARRIREGEAFDLVVLPPAQLEALGGEGLVSDGSITPLARVPAGPPPADARRATVYAGAVSPHSSHSNAALSLLIALASEDTQALLKPLGMLPP